MQISVTRTGGFAGLTETLVDLDTTKPDTARAKQIEQAVQALGFFDLPAAIAGDTVGADMFHYEIAITQGKQQHTVKFVSNASPKSSEISRLRSFVDLLLQTQ